MQIQNALVHLAIEVRLIVTTGGTGIGPRDVTPEATEAICDRLIDGVAERMRLEGAKKTAFSALSRAVCGVRGKTLILNLPGSPSGAVESLKPSLELIPHALDLLDGKTEHRRWYPGENRGGKTGDTMREMLSRAASAAVVILALSGVLTNAASQESPRPSFRLSIRSAILEPASGALLGQFYGAGTIDQTTRKLGRTPVIHLDYYGWTPI